MLESCKILILNARIDLAPLNEHLIKDVAWNWDIVKNMAFQKIKL